MNLSKVNSAEDNEKLELTQRKLEVAKDILEVYEQMGYDIQSEEVRQQISEVTGFSMIEVETDKTEVDSNAEDETDEEFNDNRETMSLEDLDIPPDNSQNSNEEEIE